MFRGLRYTLKQGIIQVFRNRNMGIASIFSITAMLLILGLFFVLLTNITLAMNAVKEDFETLQVYLLDETTKEQADTMMETIKGYSGVEEVKYLSKEQALEDWRKEWKENAHLLDSLPSNPLPNSIVVTVSQIEYSDVVVDKLQKLEGIEGVKYYKDTVNKLIRVTNSIKFAGFVIIIFLVIVSVVVVSNTIKLTVLARVREIEIMKYVGATNWFIRGPFLVEGILIGIISSLIAAGLVSVLYGKVIQNVGDQVFVMLGTPMVSVDFLASNLVYIFVSIGVSVGACGSIISMRKFLYT
ncbi:MAG: ABC transporter permease [Clostridiales bacterium]|nr:ABC transporter permease [Clostridiales bacterium]